MELEYIVKTYLVDNKNTHKTFFFLFFNWQPWLLSKWSKGHGKSFCVYIYLYIYIDIHSGKDNVCVWKDMWLTVVFLYIITQKSHWQTSTENTSQKDVSLYICLILLIHFAKISNDLKYQEKIISTKAITNYSKSYELI